MEVVTSKDMRVAGTPAEPRTHRLSWWELLGRSGWTWRRPLCDSLTSVLLEFEFTSREGFPGSMERIPTIQVCQVHTVFVSGTGTEDCMSDSSSHKDNNNRVNTEKSCCALVPKRVARIQTFQIGAVFSASECQDKANLGVILAYLVAKAYAIQHAAKCVAAPRQFLTEWLVNFVTKFRSEQQRRMQIRRDTSKLQFSSLNIEFEMHRRLRWLPRYVFGLLNSRGLAPFSSVHPDIQTFRSTQFTYVFRSRDRVWYSSEGCTLLTHTAAAQTNGLGADLQRAVPSNDGIQRPGQGPRSADTSLPHRDVHEVSACERNALTCVWECSSYSKALTVCAVR